MDTHDDFMLSIDDVARLYKLSYATVYSHRLKWGFFQMEGSRVWRVSKKELEENRKKKNNIFRLAPVTDTVKEKKCQSIKEIVHGGLTYNHHLASELESLLERHPRQKLKNITTD